MVHKRSKLKYQAKQAAWAASNYSFNDKRRGEKVLTKEAKDRLVEHVTTSDPQNRYIHQYIIDFFKPGDVVEDSRGQGVLQRMVLTADGYKLIG